jgi:hypothetical protein
MKQFDARRLAAGHPIQVVIPTRAALDIDSLFEVQRRLFRLLGHARLLLGCRIGFALESSSPGSSGCSASIPTHTQVLSNLS